MPPEHQPWPAVFSLKSLISAPGDGNVHARARTLKTA